MFDGQYGFRPQSTKTLALLNLVEEISTTIDKMYTLEVFIELKKAFDAKDHSLLLN